MPELEQEDFKFPDEIEAEEAATGGKVEENDDFSIEIEDDRPEADRNAVPLDKETVKELEEDDLKDYSKKVKQRIDQMKKVWHDERREKETALREQQEAIRVAQRLLEENKRLKEAYSTGEKTYIETVQNASELEMAAAKRNYRDAVDSGDTDRIVEAQSELNAAAIKADKVKNFRPSTLQDEQNEVQIPQQAQQQEQKVDPLTSKWLDKNTWYGPDEEMTALALASHAKLERQFGKQFVGSEDYFKRIDETMRKRFPENFSEEVQTQVRDDKPNQRADAKPAPVVAPATRSTASKRIVLKASQVAIAKKLGLTPEQYAREMQKLEA
jgi:hypothetical protein